MTTDQLRDLAAKLTRIANLPMADAAYQLKSLREDIQHRILNSQQQRHGERVEARQRQ